jgi:hypothetical protein
MKTKTFKSFLSDYAKDMSPEHSLSLFKNEQHVQKNKRLLNVFTFYVLFNTDVAATLTKKKNVLPTLYNMFKAYEEKYKELSFNTLEEDVALLDDFDELKQMYTSYKNLYVSKNEKLKKMYHQKIHQIQLEKDISNYRIYTDLKLNHGNTNDFLKNRKYNKMSIDKVKSILEYVISV